MEQLTPLSPPPYAGFIRKHFSRIGFAMLVLYGAPNIVALIFGMIAALLSMFSGSGAFLTEPWVLVLLSTLPIYLIGIPLAYLILRPMPKARVWQNNLSFGNLLALFAICIFLMYAGSLASQLLMSLANLLLPVAAENPLDSVFAIPLVPTFVIVVVLAPIFEELFFRKWLLDRIAQYGTLPAILISGITFGLFHGNLYQIVYATLLGCVFAYVYLTSGKVWPCIVLHALVNFFGGFLGMLLLPLGEAATLAFGAVLLAISAAGLIFFIIKVRKVKELQKASVPRLGKLAFGNVGMILYLVLMGLVILLFLLAPTLTHWLEQFSARLQSLY
ncbi:MAG: CPBP family intramembrane metalloprotease [Clostridiales bacterium]|nr:CPBP family intramembrane metalloprotease [Clostridiales bacterium]